LQIVPAKGIACSGILLSNIPLSQAILLFPVLESGAYTQDPKKPQSLFDIASKLGLGCGHVMQESEH